MIIFRERFYVIADKTGTISFVKSSEHFWIKYDFFLKLGIETEDLKRCLGFRSEKMSFVRKISHCLSKMRIWAKEHLTEKIAVKEASYFNENLKCVLSHLSFTEIFNSRLQRETFNCSIAK